MELGLVNLSKFLENLESKLAKNVRKLFTKLCEKNMYVKVLYLKFLKKKCEEYWYMEIGDTHSINLFMFFCIIFSYVILG